MVEQFVGCTLSIEVGGGLGYYQGTVKTVNPSIQHLTLTKVLHNGKAINKPEVSINAADILNLKILSGKEEQKQQSSQDGASQVPSSNKSSPPRPSNPDRPKTGSPYKKGTFDASEEAIASGSRNTPPSQFTPIQANVDRGMPWYHPSGPVILKRKPRTSVGEILAHGSQPIQQFSSGGNYDYGPPRRSQDDKYDKQGKRQWNKNWKSNRDETTFGTPIDEDVLNTEFDFEKNLALFDKQAFIEEIQSQKPDVVRQADRKMERKYRCDENVLAAKPEPTRQIIVPASEAGEVIYATDNGLLVPSVSVELRQNLLSTANQVGLTKSRQLEMIGRGATEIIISAIGGSHRLEPGNSHQPPIVVLLCGANAQGAAGVNCGRQLECQGVKTVVITPPLPSSPSISLLLSHEMQLYTITSGRAVTDVSSLPSTVDLIVDSRFDLRGNLGISNHFWLNDTNAFAAGSRAPVLALDPPSIMSLPFTPRITICPSLPLSYPPEKGKIYLININIPLQVFQNLEIKYSSPFGPKMVIPLHPCE